MKEVQTSPWWLQSTIYEVNLRQYSKEGTFAAFEKHLPRLKAMGIDILWFMPITPIGIIGRKMSNYDLGSYYAVRDYYAINEEFGTMEEWKTLVRNMHKMGFKVIVDWVANHTSPDHPWTLSHPEYYVQDEKGNIISPNADWSDTRQLNFDNSEMQTAMMEAMKFWITETNIDGFRCDMAKLVRTSFWKEAISQLRSIKNILMIAEAEDEGYYETGFDAQYTWSIFHAMKAVYRSHISIEEFAVIIDDNFSKLGEKGARLFFTSNHDENSWDGTDIQLFGNALKCFGILIFTMRGSLPMIYSGQEIPNEKSLAFFSKDVIDWEKEYKMTAHYKYIAELRKECPALCVDATYKRIVTGNDSSLLGYVREKEGSKILIVLNLSSHPQYFNIDSKDYNLNPWGYLIA